MALNPSQNYYIAKALFQDNGGYIGQEQSVHLSTWASEHYLKSDNVNQSLTRYPCLNTFWDCWGSGSSNWMVNGFGYYDYPQGYNWPYTYYTSGGNDVNETGNYGYVSSFVGGLSDSRSGSNDNGNHYMITGNGGSPEIIEVYGHGVPAASTTLDLNYQFRNSSSLPQDGSAVITTNGSSFSRNPYSYPCFYAVNILSTGPVSSGNVSFVMEKLPPTHNLSLNFYRNPWTGVGNAAVDLSYRSMGLDYVWYNGVVNVRQLTQILGSWYSYGAAMLNEAPLPDGSGVIGASLAYDELPSNTKPLINRYLGGRRKDPRIRERATYALNAEYFCIIYSTFVLIYSNKSTFIPLQAFDLSVSFTGQNKRIAGITSKDLLLYVISEDGELASIDFTTTPGGKVTVLPSAPLCPTGHRYSGITFAKDTNKVWALRGFYALHPWELSESGAPGVAVVSYDPVTSAWGSVADSGLGDVRVGGRDINQLNLVNGKLVFVSDVIESKTTDIPLLTWMSSVDTNTNFSNTKLKTPIRGYQVRSLSGKANARVRFKPNNAGMGGITLSAKLFQADAGAEVGETYTGNESLTFGGLSSVGIGNTYFDADPLQTLVVHPKNDYYLSQTYVGARSCSYREHVGTGNGGDSNFNATAVDDICDNNYTSGPFDNFYYDSAAPVWLQKTQSGVQDNNQWVYQVVEYDLTSGVWKATKDASFYYNNSERTYLPVTNWGSKTPTKIGPTNTNGSCGINPIHSVVFKDSVLIQLGLLRDQIFYYQGGALKPFQVGDPFSYSSARGWTVLLPNVSDGSMIIHENVSNQGGYNGLWIGSVWAMDPDFTFGTDTPYKVPFNLTNTVTKGSGICNGSDGIFVYGMGWASNFIKDCWGPFMYSDQTIVAPKLYGSSGWAHTTGFQINFAHMPKYYYWDGASWAVTSSWTKATASPKMVPVTPNESISTIDGLKLQFGPVAGSTFTAGEFHTINATYGNVKYTKRARYTHSAFTGKTFRNTETKAMSDVLAVVPQVYSSSSMSVTNISTPSYPTTGTVTWPKQVNGVWNPDIHSGVYPQVNWHFNTPINFYDIQVGSYMMRGLTWEISKDNGSTYTPISPLWRSRLGYSYTFNRQEGVTDVRLTLHVPHNWDGGLFGVSARFVDYGSQAVVDAARLGSSSAADGDPIKASWDPQCLGISHTATIQIDGGSPLLNQCYVGTSAMEDWYSCVCGTAAANAVPANRFKLHPFFGFLLMEGAKSGTAGAKAGTNVSVTYFWGRRS